MKVPSKAQPVEPAGTAEQAVTSSTLTVQGAKQAVTLCQCNRCGNIWKPRRPDPPPSKCPSCFSPLWNKARTYHIEGAEPPTRTPKPRGRPFARGFDARRSDHTDGEASEGGTGEGAVAPSTAPERDKPGPRAKRQTSRSHAPHEGEAHSTADKS